MSLGMHTIPIHYDSFGYMRQVKPQLIVTLSLDPEYTSTAFQNLGPNGRLALRHYPEEGEANQFQTMLENPSGYGHWHAEWWNRKILELQEQQRRRGLPVIDENRVTCLHINEMPVWKPEYFQAIMDTEKQFLFSMAKFNRSGGCLSINTGHPAELDDNGLPIWDDYLQLQPALSSGNHYMSFHEYWPHTGPEKDWGYLAGRLLHCPLQAPYMVTECGVDEYTKDATLPQHKRGWLAWLSPETYVNQLQWYYLKLQQTGRVVGITPFTWDSATWNSFDMLPTEDTILGRDWPTMHYTFNWETGDIGDNGDTGDVTDNTEFPDWMESDDAKIEQSIADSVDAIALASNIEPRTLMALLMVETDIQNRPTDGRPTVRLEAHILENLVNNKDVWASMFRILGPERWEGQQFKYQDKWVDYHGNQDLEYEALQAASDIWGREKALQSSSLGLGQVMGFNFDTVGYDSAVHMFNTFKGDGTKYTLGIYYQILSVFAYILSVDGLDDDLRNRDWREVARKYNGPGAVDKVSKKLEEAYNRIG